VNSTWKYISHGYGKLLNDLLDQLYWMKVEHSSILGNVRNLQFLTWTSKGGKELC
jgi:hypothetical protein